MLREWKGQRSKQVLRPEVGELYLQVLLSHYKEARRVLSLGGAWSLQVVVEHSNKALLIR